MSSRKARRSSFDRRNNGDSSIRAEIKRHHVIAGHIFFLPPKDQIKQALLLNSSIENGCFKHPVVICHAGEHTDVVKFLPITSFGGKGLEKSIRDRIRRRKYLPISPSPAHAESNFITLHLWGSAQLEMDSWVNAANEIVANWRILRPFTVNRKKSVYLTEKSLKDLLQYMVDRNFGSISPSAATLSVVSSAPQQSLTSLPTPPPSPAPHRGPPTYTSVASRSTLIEHSPRPARSAFPIAYSYTANTYTAPSPPGPPGSSPAAPIPSWQQSYLTSSTLRMPGSFPQPTDAQQDHRLPYTARHHYQHTNVREPLLPITRTRSTTATPASASHAKYSGGCWGAFLAVVTLLLFVYGIYWYATTWKL